MSEGTGKRKSIVVSVSAVFGALSALLAMLPLSFAFPPIPYLKFDVAEIPVVTAFLALGPVPGAVSAVTYWLVLNFFGEWAPIGPAMKFLAVASMLAGFWAGYKLTLRLGASPLLVFVTGTLARIVAMTLANYLLLAVVTPFFLEFAVRFLSKALGIELAVGPGGLLLVLLFTALFNLLHTVFSLVPSMLLIKSLSRQGLFLSLREPWIISLLKSRRY